MTRARSTGNGAPGRAAYSGLLETPMSREIPVMQHTTHIQPEPEIRELSAGELDHVSGAALLSSVFETRSEISRVFARNARA